MEDNKWTGVEDENNENCEVEERVRWRLRWSYVSLERFSLSVVENNQSCHHLPARVSCCGRALGNDILSRDVSWVRTCPLVISGSPAALVATA